MFSVCVYVIRLATVSFLVVKHTCEYFTDVVFFLMLHMLSVICLIVQVFFSTLNQHQQQKFLELRVAYRTSSGSITHPRLGHLALHQMLWIPTLAVVVGCINQCWKYGYVCILIGYCVCITSVFFSNSQLEREVASFYFSIDLKNFPEKTEYDISILTC